MVMLGGLLLGSVGIPPSGAVAGAIIAAGPGFLVGNAIEGTTKSSFVGRWGFNAMIGSAWSAGTNSISGQSSSPRATDPAFGGTMSIFLGSGNQSFGVGFRLLPTVLVAPDGGFTTYVPFSFGLGSP